MKITYYGHSCFSVKLEDKILLFDPYISENPLAGKIDIKSIKADYILISHGHNDHIADAAQIAILNDATVISNFEITNWLKNKGVKKTHGMNIGGSFFFEFGKAKCMNALHSSSMPDGTYGGNPVGFLIESKSGNFYYAGDTALTYDMKLIGDYKKIDFSFLPVGGNYTMDVDNALLASEFVKCDVVIGMHYDTFDVIKINKENAIRKFELAGKTLILPEIGEEIQIN